MKTGRRGPTTWLWGVQYPPMAQVAEPFLKLAGVRVEPRTRRKHDTPGGYGVAECAQTFALVDVASSRQTPVQLPAGGCAAGIVWAADGKRYAFQNTSSDAVELWIGDTTGATRRIAKVRLNPMLDIPMQWLADQKTLLVKLVPTPAGSPPAASVVADGPSIQESDGQSGESGTYETRDTLTSKHDEELFEYYGTSQLALVDATTGAIAPVGKPAVFTDVVAAPDDRPRPLALPAGTPALHPCVSARSRGSARPGNHGRSTRKLWRWAPWSYDCTPFFVLPR
jgi:dipeptidyl aminopeptidase/acylaminoacyl peptidase